MFDYASYCSKCGKLVFRRFGHCVPEYKLYGEKVNTRDCPIPDPYPIPLTREGDEQRYDEVLGTAIVELRKIGITCIRHDVMAGSFPYYNKVWGSDKNLDSFRRWLLEEATPAELFRIVIEAEKSTPSKETKDE
jgi:hypothetical protein